MIGSGFHYIYFSRTEVFLMFYDEVNNKDYPICSLPNLSTADEIVFILQTNYRKVYAEKGGVIQNGS